MRCIAWQGREFADMVRLSRTPYLYRRVDEWSSKFSRDKVLALLE